jgi:protein-tyrosine-phosphatase
MPDVLFLCTGNAARSVIAGAALRSRLPDLQIETAGTLAIDGQPMSWRTRAALEHVGLAAPAHRSRQATARDVERAELVIGLAPEHVAWVRRECPAAAGRTATLKRLSRDLPDAPGATLAARVAALGLAQLTLEPWEDVDDPGGGDAPEFVACAEEVVELVDRLAAALSSL